MKESSPKTHYIGSASALHRAGAALFAAAVLTATQSPARTIAIVSCDRETGATVLSISAAEAGDGEKALIAAWAPGDIGSVATNAHKTALVGAVGIADTSASFTIPSAWLTKTGIVRFFLMTGMPPYDSRLASLTSDGKAYIDTDFVPTVDSDIRVKAECGNDVAPFGVSKRAYLFRNTDTGWYCGFAGNTTGSFTISPKSTAAQEYWLNSTGAYIDGICRFAFDPTSFSGSSSTTLTLFARKTDGSSSVNKQGSCTIYSAQLRDGGELVHDYVPCVKDGVATMYDRSTKSFCSVSSSPAGGVFTAGAEIGPAPEDCGDVESVSDAIAIAPTLTVTAIDRQDETMTVAIGGSHGAGVLYMVGGPTDAGQSVSGWTETCFIGKVAVDTTSVTATVPTAWWSDAWHVRFVWRSAEDFPYDREVEWLRSAGTAWVDSGIVPTLDTTVAVRGKCDADVCLFGLSKYLYIFEVNGETPYGFFQSDAENKASGSFAAYGSNNGFHTLSIGPDGASIDGISKVSFSSGSTKFAQMTYSLPIFFRRDLSNGGSIAKSGEALISDVKISEGGRLLRDLVPCVANGTPCFYDRVSGSYFASEVSDAFTAGETVARLEDSDAVAWSAAATADAGVVEAVWDGGGANNSFATAENWEGDTSPDLTGGMTILRFATGGTSAQVPVPATVRGLRFDLPDSDFTLSGSPISIGADGIEFTPNAVTGSWRFGNLDLPVTVAADQTWNLSSETRQRLGLKGNLGGTADKTLTVTGSGALSINSTNDFAGTVRLSGGVAKVFSKLRPFGSAEDGGRVVVDQSAGARLEMYGSTIDKPLYIQSANIDSSCFSSREGYGTNVISGRITQSGGMLNWQLSPGSATLLKGGGVFDGVAFKDAGALAVDDTSIRNRDTTFSFDDGGSLHLLNSGNEFKVNLKSSSKMHCRVQDTMTYWADVTLEGSSVLDLHGFDQKFGDLVLAGESSRVTSEMPANILAYCDDALIAATNKGVFAGAVSFTKSGARRIVLASENTSTGTLGVQNGPLVIAPGGKWTGKTATIGAETTNRHPSLRLMHNACFADPAHTTLAMTTSTSNMNAEMPNPEPELILDEGVRHVFREITLNGKPLASGTWGSSQSSATHKDDTHFSGKGVVEVIGTRGLIITIR